MSAVPFKKNPYSEFLATSKRRCVVAVATNQYLRGWLVATFALSSIFHRPWLMSHSLTANDQLHPIGIVFLYVQKCMLLNLDNCRCIFSYSKTLLLSVTVRTSYVFKYKHLDGCVAIIVSTAFFKPIYQHWTVFLLQELSKNKSAIFSLGEWIFVVLISTKNMVCISDFDSSSSGILPITCQ